jgi:hypothetical protein
MGAVRLPGQSLPAPGPGRNAAGWRRVGPTTRPIREAGEGSAPTPHRKDRLHIDLRADGTSFEDELDRLLDLGATIVDVGQAADATWKVLGDPEGNVFCLLRRTMEEVRADQD